MVFCGSNCCKDKLNQNVFISEYNVTGIPLMNFVNVNELNFINGNVIRDMQRAIILKPITREKIVEVLVEEIDEKIVYVPQVQVVDKYVEVVKPIVKYKIKEVKRPVTVEKIKKVPKIFEEEKTIEVPEIQYVEKFVDVPKVVQKERIIEIPLPVVRERRIPVLNVSKEEKFQEVDGLEYKLGSSSFNDSSSIGIESSLSSTLNLEHNEDVGGQTGLNSGKNSDSRYSNTLNSPIRDPNNTQNNTSQRSNNAQDNESEVGEYSDLEYYSSKMANYNSSENEDRREIMSEVSIPSIEIENDGNSLSLGFESDRHSITLYNCENKIEIETGDGVLDEYPDIGSLSVTEAPRSNLDEEKVQGEIRRGKFESRVKLSPDMEVKLIENISSQIIPGTIKALKRNRKHK